MKAVLFSIVLVFGMIVGTANAAVNPPWVLSGEVVIVDQRNTQVMVAPVSIPANTQAICEASKAAKLATGFSSGNYDYKTTIQRTYSLNCYSTNTLPVVPVQ